jgi:hypothetical protein
MSGDDFDLKGVTPESWACVDCGINTGPGLPDRVNVERAYKTAITVAKISGEKDPSITTAQFNEWTEVYTVRDSVWKAAGMKPWGGCLCFGCLEKRLGRRLKPKDFPRRDPFNDPRLAATDRLFDRRDGETQ